MSWMGLKQGTQVTHTPTGAPGRIVELLEGSAKVRFNNGEEKVCSLAFLQRRRRRYHRDPVKPKDTPAVQYDCCLEEVVKARMAELNLTHTALAARSGLSRSTIYRILQEGVARQPVSTVEALATAVGVSPRDFWTEAQEE